MSGSAVSLTKRSDPSKCAVFDFPVPVNTSYFYVVQYISVWAPLNSGPTCFCMTDSTATVCLDGETHAGLIHRGAPESYITNPAVAAQLKANCWNCNNTNVQPLDYTQGQYRITVNPGPNNASLARSDAVGMSSFGSPQIHGLIALATLALGLLFQ
ncbi:hypothetical protein BC831DRAFT_547818 [Entophlyctis helioformis]|nr:hypothetical protein BC831DRAFT_547818 [Entophlyctis helioformis]